MKEPRARSTSLLRYALLTLAIALPSGCGKESTFAPTPGDTGGAHLVVFASDRAGPPGQFDLYLYDLDQLGFRSIPGISSLAAADIHPTISSDGLVIAFQSNRGGAGNSDILLYGRLQQQLIALPGVNTTADETEPAFTGDALKLAFTQAVGAVRRIRLDDGVADTLVALRGLDTTSTAFSDWAPSPSQTGSRIAFVSDRNGNPDIFVWDAAQHAVLNLPDLISPGNDVDPSLTPDGHYLCFASDRAGGQGGYDLYLYDLVALSFIALPFSANPALSVNTPSNERHPAISRSGNFLVFESDRAGLGKLDLWNCLRSTSQVGQGAQESSLGDDIDPALLYP